MRAVLTTLLLATVAILAFAGNSLLARTALADGAIEAGAFSAIRLASGALVLLPFLGQRPALSDAPGAVALAVYVGGVSLAYLSLDTASGALILFAFVQATILLLGWLRGERLSLGGWLGLALAMGGLIVLLAPGTEGVPIGPATLMAMAGVAWGAYTLIGRGATNPTQSTARYFLIAALLVAPMLALDSAAPQWEGVVLAAASGTITSALGYIVWYKVTPRLGLATVAGVQLATPVVAGIGGVALLDEQLGWRLFAGAGLILSGIILTLAKPTSR